MSIEAESQKYQVRFVQLKPPAGRILLQFTHPSPSFAVLTNGSSAGKDDSATLDITVLRPEDAKQGLTEWAAAQSATNTATPIYVRYRGVELLWQPGHAVLLCEPNQVEALLPALTEFAHYEAELRSIEQEIDSAWGEVEQDKALAFDVSTTDLLRSDEVGTRMGNTFQRRIRLARIEPHLEAPAAELLPAARRLGEELRDKSDVEARVEIVSGQLDVYEHIYEMASQRMGEYKAARDGHFIEWIIIALLGAEAALMLLQTLMRMHF